METEAGMSTVSVLDQAGVAASNCSPERAKALIGKGAAELVHMTPMTIRLTRPLGNGVRSSARRAPDAPNPSQKKRSSRLRSLRARDGSNCFYCGAALEDENVTLEHLLSEKDGGSSRLANLALAHKKCNELAADLPVVEKVLLRERLRAARTAALPDRAG
ncbi:MAG TPA: HNH endonuclease [Paraburkholderia sp.]|uniref:HNH endonuclease n=1 Tax=Paraburkholderia sp. TaxID=1926495 RepID=UPI002ED077E0